jgi:hypothetical protein
MCCRVSLCLQDPDFPALSGARVVRIAVHPELNGTGYGSRWVWFEWHTHVMCLLVSCTCTSHVIDGSADSATVGRS